MVHSLLHFGSSHFMHQKPSLFEVPPKKGSVPLRVCLNIYSTVPYCKIDGFSMSIINVVLKCYQSLNYIQYYLGLWLMIPNKTKRISENRGFPTSICRSKGASFFKPLIHQGSHREVHPVVKSMEVQHMFKPSIWSHKFGTETSGLPWT